MSNVVGVYRYEPQALAQSYQTWKAEQGEAYVNGPIRPVTRPSGTTTTTTKQAQPQEIIVAATQFTAANLPDSDIAGYCALAELAIVKAIEETGANIILLPELWVGPYFCQSQHADLLSLADPVFTDNDNKTLHHLLLRRMQRLAKEYQVVLPVSFYERCHNALYNSVVTFDADGTYLGSYRKSHIPDGPGYQEKFYFTPGNGGTNQAHVRNPMAGGVFDSAVLQCRIGVAICWDQWFPETARCLALQGCAVIFYPTAIGSEPQDPTIQSADHWQRVMQGHAAANMVPVVASKILLKKENTTTEQQRIHFYGRSFITDNVGAKIAECPDNTAETPVVVIGTKIKVQQNHAMRLAWGLFRDRRPELYQPLLTKDGGGSPL